MAHKASQGSVFQRLGVTPVINCCGVYTELGGSVLSPTVWAAMQEINGSFVSMGDLLDQTGRILADLIGAEAARVTCGASAAIALGTAACIAGTNGAASERLPDASGLKHDVLIQRGHRYKYDRCAALAGAKLVVVGDDAATTRESLDSAIGPDTAMILFPAHLDGAPGTVPLRDVTVIARRRGIPTFVDAAYLNYPTAVMRTFTAQGADLVCFSAKYFGGPNSGGFVCGRRELIDAVVNVDFTKYETGRYRKFGRAFKLDRQIVVGVVVALQEWLALNHEARWRGYSQKVETIASYLRGIDSVTLEPRCFTMEETLAAEPVNCLAIQFPESTGLTAEQVSSRLASGNPSIHTIVLDGTLVVAVDTVLDGQEQIVGERLKSALEASTIPALALS